jgi:hypothetical protein
VRPSCFQRWFCPPTQASALHVTTPAHGSFAPGGLCCPSALHYYDPIRQSRRLLPLSPGSWLYCRSLPDDLVWAVGETFPALGQCSFLTCRHPYAERRSEDPQSALAPLGLPPQNTESAPLLPPTPVSVGALLTTLQCSLHATARKVACPPGQVRPGVLLRPPRTFTPELARGRSPGSRVGYDYTALLGEDCDRTPTGWSTAVTGCTFRRKVQVKTSEFVTLCYLCSQVIELFRRRLGHIPHVSQLAFANRVHDFDTGQRTPDRPE